MNPQKVLPLVKIALEALGLRNLEVEITQRWTALIPFPAVRKMQHARQAPTDGASPCGGHPPVVFLEPLAQVARAPNVNSVQLFDRTQDIYIVKSAKAPAGRFRSARLDFQTTSPLESGPAR